MARQKNTLRKAATVLTRSFLKSKDGDVIVLDWKLVNDLGLKENLE